MFRCRLLTFSAIFRTLSALSLSPTPSSNPLDLPPVTRNSNATAGPYLGGTKPTCDSNLYGYDLNVESCAQAVSQMSFQLHAQTYVLRNTRQPEVGFQSLPSRSLSCEL